MDVAALQEIWKGAAVSGTVADRTGMPEAEGIRGEGWEIWLAAGSPAALVQMIVEVDDEEEVLELDKEPG